MAYRGRRQLSLPDHKDRHVPNNMDQLAFKYMEMCKVESSTDSDSEISPRWSDTSTRVCKVTNPKVYAKGRQSSNRAFQTEGERRCCSTTGMCEQYTRKRDLSADTAVNTQARWKFLDPYDGSSEDSDESNIDVGVSGRRTRQQGTGGGGGGGGCCRFSARSRRFILHHPASVAPRELVKNGMRDPVTEQQHPMDVQMKCGSDSDLCDIMPLHSGCRDLTEEMANDSTINTQTMDVELHSQFDDSGLHTTRSSTPHTPGPVTPVEGSSSQMLDRSSERSHCPFDPRSRHKRKLGFPGAEVVEPGQRKRQCVVNMEYKQEERDSAFEPC